ncbi:MAG: hypothetical protein FWC82_01010 [Firmicutes bacterium]|nr:hypothetical protein [Bacillota bacterium]
MTTEKAIQYLSSLRNVTRHDLPSLGLRRFLNFDQPFAVLCKEDNLHIKLPKNKILEYKTKCGDAMKDSTFYKSNRWAMVDLDKVSEPIFCDIVLVSYRQKFLSLSPLVRTIEFAQNTLHYNLRYDKILSEVKVVLTSD